MSEPLAWALYFKGGHLREVTTDKDRPAEFLRYASVNNSGAYVVPLGPIETPVVRQFCHLHRGDAIANAPAPNYRVVCPSCEAFHAQE